MSASKKWADVSTELIKDPNNFKLWQRLIESAEYNDKQGISKSTPWDKLEILRTSYHKFLERYPYCYRYWVRLAEWEFKLGEDAAKAIEVFQRGLQHLRCCIELWHEYLKFRVDTISDDVEQVLAIFEEARRSIGNHFYSYEFYSLYLGFLDTYATEKNQFKRKYYILLRIVLEVPMYHYEYFYRKWFELIRDIADPRIVSDQELKYIVSERDWQRGERNKLVMQLKKTFTDAYTAAQNRVYELYHFERQFKRQYHDVRIISRQQLDAWLEYFDFLELKNYPVSVIEMNYNRYLYICANYPQAWTKFADYYIFHQRYNSARQVLIRGWKYLGNDEVLIKLIDVEIFLKQFLRARDLITNYLQYTISVPIAIYEKLLNVEHIVDARDEHLLALFKEIIQETQNDWFFNVLTYYAIDREKKVAFLKEMDEFKGHKYYDMAVAMFS
ncbi:uncharacterized protein LODBEIA_P15320 [Lodderomyces beijingensis]|uniref:Suppressor of forked domain-containing protein n=1 Tax=Lodderomyces beijingensis TaxID=1775926 RepID=A0ABP0ZI50_9ASCO